MPTTPSPPPTMKTRRRRLRASLYSLITAIRIPSFTSWRRTRKAGLRSGGQSSGCRRPAERTGRAALYAQARRSRDHHRRAGAQRRRAQAADAEVGASLRRIHVGRSGQLMKAAWLLVAVTLVLPARVPLGAQGRGGPPPTGQAGARMDLTGYWVSVVTEDWLWRMITPPKGDLASVPFNAAGVKAAGEWDLAKDNAGGNQCKAFGAPAVMRIPGRLHITWQDANTLKVETDGAAQTRRFHFNA